MKTKMIAVLVVFGIFQMAGTVQGIRCWNCDTRTDKNCKNALELLLSPQYQKLCAPQETSCNRELFSLGGESISQRIKIKRNLSPPDHHRSSYKQFSAQSAKMKKNEKMKLVKLVIRLPSDAEMVEKAVLRMQMLARCWSNNLDP